MLRPWSLRHHFAHVSFVFLVAYFSPFFRLPSLYHKCHFNTIQSHLGSDLPTQIGELREIFDAVVATQLAYHTLVCHYNPRPTGHLDVSIERVVSSRQVGRLQIFPPHMHGAKL